MSQTWVKVFLKNGQFQTANKARSKNQDHVYQYLVGKYKNIFEFPDSPQRKRVKSKPKLRLRTNSLNNKSMEIKRTLNVEKRERSCLRCCQKLSNELSCAKEKTKIKGRDKRREIVVGNGIIKKRGMSETFKENIVCSGRLNYSMTTRPISFSIFNKRAGFIRKAMETPVQELISSENRGLRI